MARPYTYRFESNSPEALNMDIAHTCLTQNQIDYMASEDGFRSLEEAIFAKLEVEFKKLFLAEV